MAMNILHKTEKVNGSPTNESCLYDDLYARVNLNDDGHLPKEGLLFTSPDIIPYRHESANPQFFTGNWYQDVGKNLQENAPNFIYFRAKNLDSRAAKGKVYLYYSELSLLLYPSTWKRNNIRTSSGKDNVELIANSAGEIAVVNEPFDWIPARPSYCSLIGRIVTDKNPNPIPDISKIDDFAYYVATTAGISWRNVIVVDIGSPDYSVDIRYYQGSHEGTMHIGLRCTNLPVGAEVAFTCGTPGPNPPINMEKTTITTTPYQEFFIRTIIPAEFDSTITYSFWRNEKVIPSSATIEMLVFYEVDPTNKKLYNLATPLSHVDLAKEVVLGVGPVKIINVGSHTILFKEDKN